jgi:hypothetical protein
MASGFIKRMDKLDHDRLIPISFQLAAHSTIQHYIT